MQEIDKFKDENGGISRENIKEIIPYEDPFLFIDSVLKLTKREIVATKEIKAGEPYFKGHFKGFPIMPGALIIEGLGQAATLLVRYNIANHEEKDVLAYQIKSAKFFRPTFPGHTLTYKVKLASMLNLIFRLKKIAFVNGEIFRNEKLVSKVKMVLAIVDKSQFRGKYSGKK